MAYADQNGLVLISEEEALEDIKKLNIAKETMNEVLASLTQIIDINSASQGDTASAVETSTQLLKNQVSAQIVAIEESIKFISQVVENYKTIDEKMKNQIDSTMS